MNPSNDDTSDEDHVYANTDDLNQIWQWNHQLPTTHSFCMHDKITEQSRILPDKVGVLSWDGTLTYLQIDRYSTSLAHLLRDSGIQHHDVLPICFEKSRWAVVAVLAAMKAGATFVLMDPTLPLARLQNTAKQVEAKAILTSRMQYETSASIVSEGQLFVVEEAAFSGVMVDTQAESILPTVSPTTLMYIIFTSGSTGIPKGVMISHQTYSSSALPRAEAVGYTEKTRTLDFASYAFDVSIDSMLLTLYKGGCLCIPSDEDRLNDINGVIRKMQVTYAGLTPSVARVLDADVISSLAMLGLGGEAVTARDANHWGKDTRIVIGYGPCECTIGCTINSSAATGRDYIAIGKGNGANIWIVDPDNHEILMPVGEIGELLVEGPIVGQGYLHDSAKTEAAFINDPTWLMEGHRDYPGRQGRLYKSGDLVKYDPDRSSDIVFVGRKDTQVKLRGQRVELGEIEWQLKSLLPLNTNVIVEVVSLGELQPMLLAFVAAEPTIRKSTSNLRLQLAEPNEELSKALSRVDANLAKVLPRYMVPTAYISVNHIPVLISGKTDRKQLRQFATAVDIQRLDQHTTQSHAGLSEQERILRQAWSRTLRIEEDVIQQPSNFFALGGDSVAAMKLVSSCRDLGLDLTVMDTFRYPTLETMAAAVKRCDSREYVEVPPFSLLMQSAEDSINEAAQACGLDPTVIEDIYPCTPGQESLFTFAIKSATPYIAQRIAHIPQDISLNEWKEAWEKTVAATPILRTSLVQSQEGGLQQVVLKKSIQWRHSTDLVRYLAEDQSDLMGLGQNLSRYAIIEHGDDGRFSMVWTIHHAVYDGWSEPLILRKVSSTLQGQGIDTTVGMKDLVRYLNDLDGASVQNFWKQELQGAVGPQFPRLPHRDYMPTADTKLEHSFAFNINGDSSFTAATYVRAAISLVTSQHAASDDIVLSETMMGRDIPLVKVESIEGPLITTIPVRLRVDRVNTIEAYLQTVQKGVGARAQYQHYGIQNIRRVSKDAQYACEARIGLVIQTRAEYTGFDLGFEQEDIVHEALKFNPYPMMLACETQKDKIRICASFDSSLISKTQMERFLSQLQSTLWQLTQDLGRRVGDVSCISPTELNQIWSQNHVAPLSFDKSTESFGAANDIRSGTVYPPTTVSWVCNPHNPSLLSPIGCVGELWLEGAWFGNGDINCPSWLQAGSSEYNGRTGTLQRTGDLVQLQEDGSIVFVGRKEDLLCVQGHEVNFVELEAHFLQHLPTATKACAAVLQFSSNHLEQYSQQQLVVLVEQQSAVEGEFVNLLPAECMVEVEDTLGLNMTICDTASFILIEQLKKLDISIRDSFPPYMVPFTYILVKQIPQRIKQTALNQLTSKIPASVLTELHSGLQKAWTESAMQTTLTPAEDILRTTWADILKMSAEQITLDNNFFRLGADSVLAMKLVTRLRAQNWILTVAGIFQNMRLRDMAKAMKLSQGVEEKAPSYTAFSTLGNLDLDDFLSNVVKPKLANPTWSVRDVFPVTDLQALDVRATTNAPRTSVQYTMLYFDKNVDRSRLYRACVELVQIHGILRTVFIEHESALYQVVLDKLDIDMNEHKTSDDLGTYVEEFCTKDIEFGMYLGSSFMKFDYIEGNDGASCLVMCLSHALYDGTSLPMLLKDLEVLYTGGNIIDAVPFASYMAQLCDPEFRGKALSYWRNVLDGSSLSVLPTTTAKPTDKSIFLEQVLDISQRPKEITVANLITAAWALVLARRLEIMDVTFGGVTSGRQIDLAKVDNVMGPCYQFTPVRVPIQPTWTALDLLKFVQNQTTESAAYDFLGFEKIARQCAMWSSEIRSFDSVVHYQDFEDFDTMPFAGGDCKVDIRNPHGDAAYPLKIASYLRKGQLHVGVVGSENDSRLVEALLNETVTAIAELVTSKDERLLVLQHKV